MYRRPNLNTLRAFLKNRLVNIMFTKTSSMNQEYNGIRFVSTLFCMEAQPIEGASMQKHAIKSIFKNPSFHRNLLEILSHESPQPTHKLKEKLEFKNISILSRLLNQKLTKHGYMVICEKKPCSTEWQWRLVQVEGCS